MHLHFWSYGPHSKPYFKFKFVLYSLHLDMTKMLTSVVLKFHCYPFSFFNTWPSFSIDTISCTKISSSVEFSVPSLWQSLIESSFLPRYFNFSVSIFLYKRSFSVMWEFLYTVYYVSNHVNPFLSPISFLLFSSYKSVQHEDIKGRRYSLVTFVLNRHSVNILDLSKLK